MKKVDIISKVVARKSEAMASPSKGSVPPVDLSGYLLKSIWDKVFEVRTDSNGTEYIFGKLPVVTQYGITMYGLDKNLDIPSIYAGIPVDGTTITKREDGTLMLNPNIELGGASNWDELEGKPSWIGSTKPSYSYSEIEGAPDLGNYALSSDVTLLSEKLNDFLEGSDTDNIINKWKELEVFLNGLSESDNLATILSNKVGKDYVDGNFVSLGTNQSILGEKDFIGGLKVNGSPIYYDTEKKYWKFEGDLLVTGGVTMYGNDSEFIPSTIMDAIQTDGVTIRVNPTTKNLEVIGNLNGATTLGGLSNVGTWADSVADVDRIMYQQAGSSQWVAKSLSSIGGGGVSGDYLPLSGGTLVGALNLPINTYNYIGNDLALWVDSSTPAVLRLYSPNNVPNIAFFDKSGWCGTLSLTNRDILKWNDNTILHSGNYSNYALPLSGGTITISSYEDFIVKRNANGAFSGITYSNANEGALGYIGVGGADSSYPYQPMFVARGKETHTIWHSGNFAPSNYLPLTGGTITGDLGLSGTLNNRGHFLFAEDVDSARWLVTDKYWANQYLLWHSGNDGSGSGLDADLLDGQNGDWYQKNVIAFSRQDPVAYNQIDANVVTGGMLYNYGSYNYWKNAPVGMYYGHILTLKSSTMDLAGQLAWDVNHNSTSDTTRLLWWRATDAGDWVEAKWHQIAFTDSNVASATKLQTARTIWGQSFDGSGNVSGNISNTNNITPSENSSYDIGSKSNQYRAMYASWFGAKTGNTLSFGANDGTHIFINTSGNVGVGTTNPSQKLHVQGAGYFNEFVTVNGNINCTALEISGTVPYIDFHYNNSSSDYTARIAQYSSGQLTLEATLVQTSSNFLASGGITMYSDQRKKTILNHVELSLKQIADAPLIEHYYNSDDKKTTHVGSIAQYWASMNDWFCKLDNEGYYTMEIQNCALASAISIARELDRYESKTDKTINKLKKKIALLEEEVEQLRSRL